VNEPVVIMFEFERSTKNTHRFSEVVPDGEVQPIVGTLYMQRSAFADGKAPDSIKVTVEHG